VIAVIAFMQKSSEGQNQWFNFFLLRVFFVDIVELSHWQNIEKKFPMQG